MKLVLSFLCLALSHFLAAQTATTVHRTFNATHEIIELRVQGSKVEIRETKSSRILIEISISADVSSPTILNYLANEGRYDLTAEVNQAKNTLVLSPPTNLKPILVKGKEAKEEVSYVVYLPAKVKFANVVAAPTASAKP